ncbi:Ltp family lipoprotein [Amycolatopsis mongoliensis]|uniref:Ltp family lipoprotein n=1 Tax=Amycolatopsis mongoliensis TaxID=715475 RepID=A0A9Y2NDT5_9PSEU|nr:Ltp family lipoprotein [Amycolatopsis sp. 4-36]WIY01052.1 Ltp family lipoprotein [Amycolatopsis sp. 4-36]
MAMPVYPQPQPPKRRWRGRTVVLALLGVFAVLVIAAIVAAPKKADTPTGSVAPFSANTEAAAVAPTTTATEPPASVSVASPTTTEQKFPPQVTLARTSAQNYLSFAAFSRNGLIRQLSSSAGDGYPKDVATQAVDSLGVDWNEQAVKSAENYLSFTSFSCSGLKQQLSSSAGEGFTKAEAAYGASRTDACK